MKKLFFLILVLGLVCLATAALAQSWNWQYMGLGQPAEIYTKNNVLGWFRMGYAPPDATYQNLLDGTNPYLRIIDNTTTDKIMWQAAPGVVPAIDDNISSGLTLAFRIRGISCPVGETPYVINIANQLIGTTTSNLLRLRMTNDGTHIYLQNSTSPTKKTYRIDDGWHTFWSKHTAQGASGVRYQIYWDGVLSEDYTRFLANNVTSTAKIGIHGADVDADPGYRGSYDLDYYAISLDGAWDPNQLPDPNYGFGIVSGPTYTVAPDEKSFTVTWTTNLPDTSSEVHWGTDKACSKVPDNSTVTVEPGTGGKTSHSVTIPIAPDNAYWFKVVSKKAGVTNAVSSMYGFKTQYIVNENIDNPGFEDGVLDPWVQYGNIDGLKRGYTFGLWPHTYDYHVCAIACYNQDNGGVYQVVGTTPGQYYKASTWIWTRRDGSPSHGLDNGVRIGIDPTGGTDPTATTVAWGPRCETKDTQTDGDKGSGGPWEQIACGAKALSTTATVFIQMEQDWGLYWNIDSIDDAAFVKMPPPPPTIGETKSQVDDGWPADLSGKVVTASWPDEKRFYIEESDRSSGMLVHTKDSESVPAIGKLANVSGTMASTGTGDRVVNAITISADTDGTMPKSLGMSNAAISSTNTSLLTTVWGKVLENPLMPGTAEFYAGSDSAMPDYDAFGRSHIYVDDGSGVDADFNLVYDPNNGTWVNFGRFKGVKVYYHPGDYAPMPGDYVIVTGIAGQENSDSNWFDQGGDGVRVRTLEVRNSTFVPGDGTWLNYGDFLVFPAQF